MAWGALLSLGLLAPHLPVPRPGGLPRLLCWQLSLRALFPGWQEAEYLVPQGLGTGTEPSERWALASQLPCALTWGSDVSIWGRYSGYSAD